MGIKFTHDATNAYEIYVEDHNTLVIKFVNEYKLLIDVAIAQLIIRRYDTCKTFNKFEYNVPDVCSCGEITSQFSPEGNTIVTNKNVAIIGSERSLNFVDSKFGIRVSFDIKRPLDDEFKDLLHKLRELCKLNALLM